MTPMSIAIIGGGMTSAYLLKHFIEQGDRNLQLTILERDDTIGPGMAYNAQQVNLEHLANSGSQEIPDLIIPMDQWLREKDDSWLAKYELNRAEITPKKIYSRVVLGEYFKDQFDKLVHLAEKKGIKVIPRTHITVTDMEDVPDTDKVKLKVQHDGHTEELVFDKTIIATGHHWPDRGKAGLMDSPWPASKLVKQVNHPVGILGSSLSGVDTAITLGMQHGHFERQGEKLAYIPNQGSENFKMTMYSRRALLPDLRCHFQFPEHDIYRYIKKDEIDAHRKSNDGYVSLDYFFDTVYKRSIQKVDPVFYDRIKDMSLETFVEAMIRDRQSTANTFDWLKQAYHQSKQSIADKKPMFWKEILDDVTYTLSFNAKYLSAEDMIRFKREWMPLAAYVVAFMPLESAEKLIALHDAGKLDIKATGNDMSLAHSPEKPGGTIRYQTDNKQVEESYQTFIKATGQQATTVAQFPFKTLLAHGIAQEAALPFRSPEKGKEESASYRPGEPVTIEIRNDQPYLKPGGFAVNDEFRLIGKNGVSPRIYSLAIPDILGFYPYTQSLPFCNHAAEIAVQDIMRNRKQQPDTPPTAWTERPHGTSTAIQRFGT